jgi:hypothetical protein
MGCKGGEVTSSLGAAHPAEAMSADVLAVPPSAGRSMILVARWVSRRSRTSGRGRREPTSAGHHNWDIQRRPMRAVAEQWRWIDLRTAGVTEALAVSLITRSHCELASARCRISATCPWWRLPIRAVGIANDSAKRDALGLSGVVRPERMGWAGRLFTVRLVELTQLNE